MAEEEKDIAVNQLATKIPFVKSERMLKAFKENVVSRQTSL